MKKGKLKDEPKKAVKEKIELDASSETVRRYAEAYQGDRLGIGRGDVLDKAIEWRGDLWVVTAVCYGPQEEPDHKIVFVEAWRLTPADQYRKKNLDGDAQYAGHFVKYDGKDYAITYPQLHFINKGPRKIVGQVGGVTIITDPGMPKDQAVVTNGVQEVRIVDIAPEPVKVEAKSETLTVNMKTGELVDAITVKVTPAPEPAPMVMPSSGPDLAPPSICKTCDDAHADGPVTPPCDPTCPAKKKAPKKPKASRASTPSVTPAPTIEQKPTLIKPPKGARGNSWFWGLMKEGEIGKDLADRLPDLPVVDPVRIVRWTKVTGGEPAVAVVAVADVKDGNIDNIDIQHMKPYSCIVYKGQLLAGNPGRTIDPLHLTKVKVDMKEVRAAQAKVDEARRQRSKSTPSIPLSCHDLHPGTKAIMPSKDGFDPRMPKTRFLKLMHEKTDSELKVLNLKYLQKKKMVGRTLYLELLEKEFVRRGMGTALHPKTPAPAVRRAVKKAVDHVMKDNKAIKRLAKAVDKVKPATIKACPSRHKSKANGTWYCKMADDGSYCVSEVGPDVSAYECPYNFQYAPDIDRELPVPHRRKFFRITARQSVVAKLAEMNQAGHITDRSGPKKIVQLLGDDWVVAGGLGTGAGGEEQVELWRVVPRVDWKKRVKTYVQLCGRRDGSGFTDGYNGFGFKLRGMDLVMTRPELTVTLTPKELAAVHAKVEAYTTKHERKPKAKKTAPKVKDKAIKFVKMKTPPAPAHKPKMVVEEKPRYKQTVLEDFVARSRVR